MGENAEKPSTIKQVLSLQGQSKSELKDLWQTLFREVAPPYHRDYLIPRLAYQLQVLAYGPLNEKDASCLKNLVGQMKKGKEISKPILKDSLVLGTKLVRTYQGIAHEVIVAKEGFVYQGQHYKSLSAIARKITGSRWNGPLFFGLRK